jgi:hypothetical protein
LQCAYSCLVALDLGIVLSVKVEGVADLLIWYSLLEDECYQLCMGVP